MSDRRLNRRDFLRLTGVVAGAAVVAACQPAAPEVVEVIKEVPVEKEVIKEVVKEVPVEKVVEKEVEVEKVVEKVVEKEVEVEVTAAPRADVKPVIRWQTWSGDYQVAGRQTAESFMEDHPDIDLIVEPQPPGGKEEKLVAAMIAGVSPDIFHYWGLWFAKLNQRGLLMDIQPFVDATMTQEDFDDQVPKGWDIFGRLSFIPGRRLAMPKYYNFMWLWYNEDILDERGLEHPDMNWTTDDWAEAALAATDFNADGSVKHYGGGFNGSHNMERNFYNLERFGGAFVRRDAPDKCLMGLPESQEGFEWLRARLWDDQSFLPRLEQTAVAGQPVVNQLTKMWETGELGFDEWNNTDGVFHINFQHPPIGPAERTSYLVSDGEGMWAGTRWPEAAWEVDKYLAEPKAQEHWCRAGGVLPVRMSVVRKWPEIMVEGAPWSEGMNLHVPEEAFEMGYGRDDERFLCQAEAEEYINPLLEKVMVVGTAPVSVLADVCADVESVQQCLLAEEYRAAMG
jgi:multiple sugar transport system substrate-binding protein